MFNEESALLHLHVQSDYFNQVAGPSREERLLKALIVSSVLN